MITSLGGMDGLTRAQGLLESSARRISQGPPAADDIVNLIRAREQFGASVKVIQTEDQMNKKLLDVFG